MEPIALTESLILEHSYAPSFRRGEDYFQRGAVVSLVRQGDDLLADVVGSRANPYRVVVTFHPTTIDATCTCPYESGGWCKHIVAVLLAYLDQADSIEEHPWLEDLLGRLDRDQLQALLLRLIRNQPSLTDVVEAEISLLQPRPAQQTPAASGQPEPVAIDAGAVRKRVHAIVHGLDHMRRSDAYWHMGEIGGGISALVEDVWPLIRSGDNRGALIMLDAITSEYFGEWMYLDDSNGDASAPFTDLGAAWTEAILAADLTAEEREDWADRLNVWSDELYDYGIESFWEAAHAAQQGWDHPLIQAALRGEFVDEVDEEEPDDDVYDEEVDGVFFPPLIDARLNVLERQGKFEDFLNLALVAHRHDRYAAMLARLGRIDEAVEHARGNLRRSGQALSVVEALWEQGEQEKALALAEWGIALPDTRVFWQPEPRTSLAVWLRDHAGELGQRSRALEGALVALRETTNLPNYLQVQKLAGEDWPQRREEVLKELRQPAQYGSAGHVDIFLHEGLIDDAIREAERTHDYRLIERVARAAVEARPLWAIDVCQRQAAEIMDAGDSQNYDVAVRWLELAGSAYPVNRLDEWLAYLDDLIERHRRKHKLRPMLENLRYTSQGRIK